MSKKKILIILLVSIWIVAIFGVIVYLHSKSNIKEHYDKKTKIKTVAEYIIKNGDTIFHGKFVQYNSKGVKILECNFVNDEPVGKTINFYDNGKIQSILYKINSKMLEEGTWNYPNGKVERYSLYNDFGKFIFTVKFNEKGNVTSYRGMPLIEIYQYKLSHKEQFNVKTDQFLKVGDKLKYKYILANIPNAKRSFKIENLSVDNSKVKRTLTKRIPTFVDVEEILAKKGINTIRAIVQYQFNDKITPSINDTITFEVEVH